MVTIRGKRSKSWLWQPRLEALESRRLLSIRSDFNGDGFDDLAIGSPEEDIGAVQDAGAVNVVYGSHYGLTANFDNFWRQGSLAILQTAEPGDKFGSALAAGDFNNDTWSDLAIGVPFEDINSALGTITDAGVVHVILGSANGLTPGGNKVFRQGADSLNGDAAAGDLFGYSLTTGYFNNDMFADLAIGVPGQRVGNFIHAGAVQVLYGSSSGLTGLNDVIIDQESSGIAGTSQTDDKFGSTLVSGDFNGDLRADLAVGVPNKNVGVVADAGVVHVIPGANGGLNTGASQMFQQGGSLLDAPETNDGFGTSLAAGDFDGDDIADLAIGAPYESIIYGTGMYTLAGAVHVLYGTSSGLGTSDDQFWNMGSATDVCPGCAELPAGGDYFGLSLAAGDFNGDSVLVIGVPFRELPAELGEPGVQDAGAIVFLSGSPLNAIDGAYYQHHFAISSQDPFKAEATDLFGKVLAFGNFNGDEYSDLVMGTPNEDLGKITDAGIVQVTPGSNSFLDLFGTQVWHQNVLDVEDDAEPFDRFGAALGASGEPGAGVGGSGAPSGGGGDGGRTMSADILDALEHTPSTQTPPDVPAHRLVAVVRPTTESESDSERTEVASVKQPALRASRPTRTSRVLNEFLTFSESI